MASALPGLRTTRILYIFMLSWTVLCEDMFSGCNAGQRSMASVLPFDCAASGEIQAKIATTNCTCTEYDYTPVYGACVGGSRSVRFRRDSDCTGGVGNPVAEQRQPCQCSVDDLDSIATTCDPASRSRNVFFFWRQPRMCVGGDHLLPSPKLNQKCDIICGRGSFLNPSGVCESCSENTFSVGGGSFFGNWSTLPEGFSTQCFTRSPTARRWSVGGNCSEWTPEGQVISSGQNAGLHYLVSFLKLHVHMVRDGYVRFAYRVEAEQGFDYFWFLVDEVPRIQKVSRQLWWAEVNISLPAGPHVLRWQYNKDASVERGSDSAQVKEIEVVGTTWTNGNCEVCAPGYQAVAGSGKCSRCPANTIMEKKLAGRCIACPPQTYALPGASECVPRPGCTDLDYTLRYGPCRRVADKFVRRMFYQWLQPHTCDEDSGEPLPQHGAIDVPCAACPAGFERLVGSGDCTPCPSGSARSTDMQHCEPCPEGTEARRRISYVFDPTDEWPTGLTSGCDGDCASDGWRLQDLRVDSGPSNGPIADIWLQANVVIQRGGGSVLFNYTVETSDGLDSPSGLEFYLNGDEVGHIRTGGAGGAPNEGSEVVHLPEGHLTLRWSFRRRGRTSAEDLATLWSIVVDGAEDGGAVVCDTCGPGWFSGPSSALCQKCPPGQISGPGSAACQLCPPGTFRLDQSRCEPCKLGTQSTEGASECVAPCAVTDIASGYKFNLTGLASGMVGPVVAHGAQEGFYLSVCAKILKSDTNARCLGASGVPLDGYSCIFPLQKQGLADDEPGSDASAVSVDDDSPARQGVSGGRVASYSVLPPEMGGPGVLVRLTGGDSCRYAPQKLSVEIELHCDIAAGAGFPVQILGGDRCVKRFRWASAHACRQCVEKDFSVVQGVCDEGLQRQTFITDQVCYGGYKPPAPEITPCTSLPLPVPVLVSIVLGAVVFLAAVLALYIRHRRVYSRYLLLRQEFDEMGDIKLDSTSMYDDSENQYSLDS